jgi:hypothetical protein
MQEEGPRGEKKTWWNIIERGSELKGRLQSDYATANLRLDYDNKIEERDGQHSGTYDRDRSAEHVAYRKQ